MTSKLEEIIQISLNREEAAYVNSMLALGAYTYYSDLAGVVKAGFVIDDAIRRLGKEKLTELTQRLDSLFLEGFAGTRILHAIQRDEKCTHCACSDRTCCWCGEYKDL